MSHLGFYLKREYTLENSESLKLITNNNINFRILDIFILVINKQNYKYYIVGRNRSIAFIIILLLNI